MCSYIYRSQWGPERKAFVLHVKDPVSSVKIGGRGSGANYQESDMPFPETKRTLIRKNNFYEVLGSLYSGNWRVHGEEITLRSTEGVQIVVSQSENNRTKIITGAADFVENAWVNQPHQKITGLNKLFDFY